MRLSRLLATIGALSTIALVEFPLTTLAQNRPVRARVSQPVDVHDLVTLQGNVHPLARPEFDQGVAPDDLPMERMLLVLQRGAEQEAALRQLLDDQQVKSSPRFHQWLIPEDFGQQFGPADSDLQAVTDWLTSQGFESPKVSAGRTIVEFSGTAGLVRQVLGTEIHRFRVNGEDHWANTSDPRIPTALAPVVAGFASLNNFPRHPMVRELGTFSRSKLTGEVRPLFTYSLLSGGDLFVVGPADFATIYNVLPLWNAAAPTDGTGQTIAVVGETNINLQDVADFRAMFGLPPNVPNIILNGPDPGIINDEIEADLDVQWSGAVAKGATIDLVVSETTESTPGIDLSALYIIDNNLAPVMSESYGACEAIVGAGGNQFYNTLWEQAAAEGITVLMAAGDAGSAGCDGYPETAAQNGLAVSGLASTPFNVAVGGTDFNDASDPLTYWSQTNTSPAQSSALSYIPESTWNDSCASSGVLTGCSSGQSLYLAAGSGGVSSCTNPTGTFPAVTCSGGYSKPSWQSGTGVPADGARDVPDVSLFAGDGRNFSYYVICRMDANANNGGSSGSCDLNSPYLDFQGAGGTSTSTQAFAGVMALVNQRYGRQGNANYVLYPMAAQSGASCNSSTASGANSSCIFYDVTVGNNSVACQGGSPDCSSATSGQYGIMVSGSPAAAAYTTTTGYDLATGLGSVNVANLVNNWKSNFTPSSTTLALSTSPATNPITLTHGQPVNFTINVAAGKGTPAGDVSLIAPTGSGPSNATGIGPFTLGGGSVSDSTIMLPGGSYNVTAHYAGNGTFASSDSSPGIPVTVGKESSQTAIRLVTFDPSSGAPSYGATTTAYGSPYVLRMDVTNSSGQFCTNQNTGLISYGCPTGSLTVSPAPIDGNAPPGTVPGSYTLNSQGYAEDEPIQQTPGQYNFVATYAGDNSYTASTSPTVPITITKAPTTTSISGVPSSPVSAGQVTVTAVLTTQSNGGAPTGTMQLMNNGAPMGSPTAVFGTAYSSSGYATAQATFYEFLSAGNYSLSVQYSGDANYASSTSAASAATVYDFSLSVNPSSLNISAPGQSTQSTISITPEYGFALATNLTCTVPPDTGLTCTIAPSSLNVTGSSAVTATLTVNSTGNSSLKPLMRQPQLPSALRLPAGLTWLLVGLLALATLTSLAVARRRPAAWLFVTALLVVGVWVACGGGGAGNGGGGPPPPVPAVSLSATSLNFGTFALGSSSPFQTVTLTNSGTATLNLQTVGVGGADYVDFSPNSQDTCFNAAVAPAGTCVYTVAFAPQAPGPRSAVLTFNDNAANNPQTVTLSGTGVQPPTPAGSYSIQVIAIGGADVLAHQATLPLTVQ